MSPKDEKKTESERVKGNGDIQSIHEMISEALLGTSSGTRPLDYVYTGANFKTDNLPSLIYNLNNNDSGPLTLGKIYSQFKDLDLRLTRVEEIIYKQDDLVGKKRTTTMARSDYSSDPCFVADHQGTSPSRLSDFTTINPILTSSADILSISSFENSDSFAYSLASQTPQSSNNQKKDDIKRSELDHYCLPLLEVNPKPTTEQLQEIANLLAPIYPQVTAKQLLSKVREWFRKRREYMSQRIFQVCSELFRDLKIETESELEVKISELNRSTEIIDYILIRADLEITDRSVAKEYCHEKILSYFNGLYRPSAMKGRLL